MSEDTDDWKVCSSRAPWVKNSLKVHAEHLRQSARHLRKKNAGKFYAEPADFLADAFAEAAAVYERKLAELEKAAALPAPPSGDAL